ncbi:MAG: AarF/ABC1/UbiB kinase family protein [Opitutaceae bacterium]|nr:AarF/ABC1/UbiB kinase family protein [Cephaloticoccus sp.]MCP5531220.1 AarF/ABC1/UbiB kinase family protein [Opitutaceae bacterium]
MKPFDLLSHAVRAKEILTVLARHGFADLISQVDWPSGFWQRFAPEPTEQRSTYERIRLAAEELGPTFVKLGQILSMRPDLLPYPLILELRQLQDHVKPLEFEKILPVIERELPGAMTEVFSNFDRTPAATASLAQVYFATLKTTGAAVAVKVQKPDIRHNIEIDLNLAVWLAEKIQNHVSALQAIDLKSAVEQARRGVLSELNFETEARNQEYFNTLNRAPEEVFAPEVYPDYSTERLIVMDRVDGDPVGRAQLPPEKLSEIARHGAASLMRQVLIHGFFHADPHSGNVLISKDGRLCFLDWGLAGHLTRRLRYALADFWVAAVEQDADRIVQIAADLAPVNARPDLRAMEKEITLALREELNFSIGRQELGRAMLKLLFIFGRHGIPLSRDYSLMAKAVLSIEEVGRTLDADFDLRKQAAGVIREVQFERNSPRTFLRRSRELLRGTLSGLQDLPSSLHRLMRRLEHDNITINLQHRGLEDHDDAMKIAANRITLGVIIGALIIGSSLIVTTGIQPHLLGYPALGIVGYLLSAILGLYIIWDIIRHGRHK